MSSKPTLYMVKQSSGMLLFVTNDVSLRKAIDSKDDAYIRSVLRPKIRGCNVVFV